tara:strand:+ start:83652 stop:87296 length:3645 start_codon:yes stop_codon:yes gene_type:complete
MPVLNNISGWNEWLFLDTNRGGVHFPSASLPSDYVPTTSFLSSNFAIHCSMPVPWTSIGGEDDLIIPIDPISALPIIGVGQSDTQINRGIGGPDGFGPILGYCLGQDFYEMQYWKFAVIRPQPGVLSWNASTDILERARLHRIYLIHGTVESFFVDINDPTRTSIDLGDEIPDGTPVGGTLRISGQTGGGVVTIIGAQEGNLIVQTPGFPIPVGARWQFSDPICIRDPFMMAGFWIGTETEKTSRDDASSTDVSGYQLFATSANSPYEKLKSVGQYFYINKSSSDLAIVGAGASMKDANENTWSWRPFGETSEIWGDSETRFKEKAYRVNTATGEVTKEDDEEREAAPASATNAGLDALSMNFYRIELDKGGAANRHNWHAPILAREFAIQNGEYFKILGQPECNIIDISINDIQGGTTFDVEGVFSIVNQHAWMLNEFYFAGLQTPIFSGPFSGSYDSVNDVTTGTIKTSGESETVLNNNFPNEGDPPYLVPNSYYRRFRDDYSGASGITKGWTKFQGWKLYDEETSYEVTSISFSDDPGMTGEEFAEYDINITVKGDASDLSDLGKIIFDSPYKRIVGSQGLLTGTVYETVDQGPRLCFDWKYDSAGFERLNISNNSVVGVCGGFFWGVDEPGISPTSLSPNDFSMAFTSKASSISISAFKNELSDEDLVVYGDKSSLKLNVRRGNLTFRENPKKIEIAIGHPTHVEALSGAISRVPVLTDKGRLHSIQGDLPDTTEEGEAMFFKQRNGYHGFLVGGEGQIDLQALRYQGFLPGETPINTYLQDENFVSPVYVYKRHPDVQHKKTEKIYWGADVSEEPFSIENGSLSDVKVEYYEEHKTLGGTFIHDAYLLEDDEVLLVYSRFVRKFVTESGGENDTADWSTSESIFLLGGRLNGATWSAPMFKSNNYIIEEGKEERYLSPLMVLNACKFLGSFYDRISNKLTIFYKTLHDQNISFIGALNINVTTSIYNNVLAKEELIEDELYDDFLIRPHYFKDSADPYTWEENALKGASVGNGAGPKASSDMKGSDNIFRIMGSSKTNSQIITIGNPDITFPTFSILVDNTQIMLYGEEGNLRLASSFGPLSNWYKSDIILARDASSGLLLKDEILLIISDNGLQFKDLSQLGILRASKANVEVYDLPAGDYASDIEEIQQDLDNEPIYTVDPNPIGAQRLSGYIDTEGMPFVFYYDNNKNLIGRYSIDLKNWIPINNF